MNLTINIEAQMTSAIEEDDESDVHPRISNKLTIQCSYSLDDEENVTEAAAFSIARNVRIFVSALLRSPSYGSQDPGHEAKLDLQ
jgi:hypothetical protein